MEEVTASIVVALINVAVVVASTVVEVEVEVNGPPEFRTPV